MKRSDIVESICVTFLFHERPGSPVEGLCFPGYSGGFMELSPEVLTQDYLLSLTWLTRQTL